MEAGRQGELDLGDPLLVGLGFGLQPFRVLLEVVGEVAVQVEAARVVPALADHVNPPAWSWNRGRHRWTNED